MQRPKRGKSKVPARSDALKVSFCQAHSDEKMRDRRAAHLSSLKRMWIIEMWHDRKISPGDDWNLAIDRNLMFAELILLLISPDFLKSDYCSARDSQSCRRAVRKDQTEISAGARHYCHQVSRAGSPTQIFIASRSMANSSGPLIGGTWMKPQGIAEADSSISWRAQKNVWLQT